MNAEGKTATSDSDCVARGHYLPFRDLVGKEAKKKSALLPK
jgi:hypothetical protein